MSIKRILFVCTGNTCRSPMAEAMFKHMLEKEGKRDLDIRSAGVQAAPHEPISPRAREALAEIGVSAPEHGAHRVGRKDLQEADLVLVMERRHRSLLTQDYPDEAAKISVLKEYVSAPGNPDIADPVGGSQKDYQKCRIELQDSLLALLTLLKSSEGSPAS